MVLFKKRKKNNLLKLERNLITISNSKSIISEQFRTIRSNITFSAPREDLKTLLVTSSLSSEGKSTNVANLGVVFAQEGKKVLLVDADMRRPTLHHTFRLSNREGLSSILIKHQTIQEAVQETSIVGLDVITSGPLPPNPSELLASQTMDTFISIVTQEYDLVIFDSPPLLPVTDARILSNKCNATLLIVNRNKTKKADILKSRAALENSQAKILGIVLNNSAMPHKHHYYQYH
ncbi:CpsD/CapB family tyrosine-protein kinase [Rummeliibacillus sp. TYF005]|uniref:CpsD/CapB family tyrosine-protein kinase n=1 Tax=Rummeliibacillus sp. TYF005 TaxID=2058214 RepID=UPI000F530225|nr:CpsD/CapB family tyrosine-protein kinase [Rummeliibacillus sp. TYF005]RPJ96698.1 polysaccharide biosynthesis tyrosine autokinase [Rummeliibacillus sp. TYF005]